MEQCHKRIRTHARLHCSLSFWLAVRSPFLVRVKRKLHRPSQVGVWVPSACSLSPIMGKHFTDVELNLMDKVLRVQKGSTEDAFKAVSKRRLQNGEEAPSKCSVYRYVAGDTFRRGQEETRGRQNLLTRADVLALQRARKRLVKAANSEYRVTYADIIAEARLDKQPSERTVADALREKGVRFRTPRRKIAISAKDAKARYKVAKEWAKKRSDFWVKAVHAYVDNKSFPLPLTPQQRSMS